MSCNASWDIPAVKSDGFITVRWYEYLLIDEIYKPPQHVSKNYVVVYFNTQESKTNTTVQTPERPFVVYGTPCNYEYLWINIYSNIHLFKKMEDEKEVEEEKLLNGWRR